MSIDSPKVVAGKVSKLTKTDANWLELLIEEKKFTVDAIKKIKASLNKVICHIIDPDYKIQIQILIVVIVRDILMKVMTVTHLKHE